MKVRTIALRLALAVLVLAALYAWGQPSGQQLLVSGGHGSGGGFRCGHSMGRMVYPYFFWMAFTFAGLGLVRALFWPPRLAL